MPMHPIATIISYCTTDYQFIGHCIREASKFSNEVIVVYSDYFFDGVFENQELLKKTILENPSAKFIEYKYDFHKNAYGSQYWVTYGRAVGFSKLSKEMDYVFFLDADEVAEGNRVLEWLNTKKYQKYKAMTFANYWYFRKPCYQALKYEDSIVLCRKNILSDEVLVHPSERGNILDCTSRWYKKRKILGLDHKPLFHHYSWVRTKEEMLRKVKSWSHNKDKNWVELVEKEFMHEFNGTDFVHGYNYTVVEPYVKQ